MPYTTLTPGTTITSSWANANVRDQCVTPFASASARTSAITSPVAGMATFQTDTNSMEAYDGTGWSTVGRPIKAVRITNTGAPMYTTSAAVELNLGRYAMTGLPALDSSKYYLYQAGIPWAKSTTSDLFDIYLRANTATSGQQIAQTYYGTPELLANAWKFISFIFKGDGGHALSITSLYLSVLRAFGSGTLSVYGANTDTFNSWAILREVGNGVNWTDVA